MKLQWCLWPRVSEFVAGKRYENVEHTEECGSKGVVERQLDGRHSMGDEESGEGSTA